MVYVPVGMVVGDPSHPSKKKKKKKKKISSRTVRKMQKQTLWGTRECRPVEVGVGMKWKTTKNVPSSAASQQGEG